MSHAATPVGSTPVEPAETPETDVATSHTAAAPAVPPPPRATPAVPAPAKRPAPSLPAKNAAGTSSHDDRSPTQIQAEIDAAQARLASRVDELSDRLNPQHLADDAVGSAKRLFVHEDGSPKSKPIAAVVGGFTALMVLRKLFHR